MLRQWRVSVVPGEPAKIENGGTTVSGGSTEPSSILQQSLRMHDRDCGRQQSIITANLLVWTYLLFALTLFTL